MSAGLRLRTLREKLGFTMRDVEVASLKLVQRFDNPKYWVPQSRLSHIENRDVTPNIYRLHGLAMIYRTSLRDLLEWFGIDASARCTECAPLRTHLSTEVEPTTCEIPVELDPMFDQRKTCYIRRMIQEWGPCPMAELKRLQNHSYTYGYVGDQDYTMYPLILPGSFLQIDHRVTTVETGSWISEFERPIYFFETHEGYICAWATMVKSTELQIQPHNLSGLPAKTYKFRSEIDVVGQVVGIATRLSSAMNRVSEPESVMTKAHI